MRDRVTTGAEIGGLALVAFGVGLLSVAAGVIAAGVALVLVGYLEGRK